MTATPEGDGPQWKVALELLGAAAGIVVLLTLVGSAIMWARFHALDLPATRAVALLPRDYLLSVGATTLVLAMLLGLVAWAALHLLRSLLPKGTEHIAGYLIVVVLEIALLTVLAVLELGNGQLALTLAAGLLAGGVFIAIDKHVATPRRVGLCLFFLVTILGGVLGGVRNGGQPVKLDMAIIHLADGSLTSGAYVATTDEGVYFAPDSFDRVYGQLAVVPRDQVASMSISEPRDFRSAGARETTPLLARGGDRSVPFPERRRQVEKYLAGWAGDPIWKYPPISFLESEQQLRAQLEVFVPSNVRPWTNDGTKVPLRKLVEQARGYSGRAIITRGRVLQVIVPAAQRASVITQFLVLEARGRSRARVICAATTRAGTTFPEGTDVEARGLVIAAGTMATSSDRTAKGAFLQCSGARRRAAGPV